jgi:hypothetical protein
MEHFPLATVFLNAFYSHGKGCSFEVVILASWRIQRICIHVRLRLMLEKGSEVSSLGIILRSE